MMAAATYMLPPQFIQQLETAHKTWETIYEMLSCSLSFACKVEALGRANLQLGKFSQSDVYHAAFSSESELGVSFS